MTQEAGTAFAGIRSFSVDQATGGRLCFLRGSPSGERSLWQQGGETGEGCFGVTHRALKLKIALDHIHSD